MTPSKFIIKHLSAWCSAQFATQSNTVFDSMLRYLMELEEWEYKDALDKGWWAVFDSIEGLKSGVDLRRAKR